MTFTRMGAKPRPAGRPVLRALALTLALAAYFALAFAPLAHGLVHGDHLIEALIDAHENAHQDAHGPTGGPHHGVHCALYEFCLAPAGLAPDAPQIAPLADAHPLDLKPLSVGAPLIAARDLPRARGPPLV